MREKNKMGEELEFFAYEDEYEDIHQYGVAWYNLCGYFCVSLRCDTKEEAMALFVALKRVSDISET